MGSSNLVNVNFTNIGSQIKIIDTLKYYQTMFADITTTADEVEKDKIKKCVQVFLSKHAYFSKIWLDIDESDKEKILDIVAEGKGALPYEKIVDVNSLQATPENVFFDHTEFFSSLNQCNISFKIYENMKYLYTALKMRSLGDMNDLYNTQDVTLLCKIIENRFQKMQDRFGFNPRKCNSANTLSGCIQRNLSKVIITLPTNYKHAEMFERTLTGGYSCANNRLGFDTEVLLPNFSKPEYAKMNIDESFQAYKNQNFKIGYKIKLDPDKQYTDYRVISKIIKFDESN